MTNADAATGQQDATRPGGTGGQIHDANKALASDEAKSLYQRQKEALAVTFRPPSKMGAPTKYEDWMPAKVFDLLTNRDVIFTKKMIATRLGITTETLRQWVNIHEDLSAAIAQGLAEQEGWLASIMATGMKYSASTYAVLKNLHDWKEKTEDTHKLSIGEALEQQQQGAKRVDWDRTRPDPLAAAKRALPVVDVVHTPTPPTHTPTPPPHEGEGTHGDASAPATVAA